MLVPYLKRQIWQKGAMRNAFTRQKQNGQKGHGECEKYKAWKAENDQQREAIKEFKRQDYALRDKTHLNRREKH